jgi:hypothetical protein
MTPAVARLSYAVLALPLAAMFLFVLLTSWPLALQNSAPRLVLIAYVIACPLLPLLWRKSSVALILGAGIVALVVQVVAVGIINFWF